MQVRDVFAILGRVAEGPGELKQQGAESSRFEQRRQAFLELLFICRSRISVVREAAPQLRRKAKIFVLLNSFQPIRRCAGRDRTVKGKVDLDGVEIIR